jgi:hypothetical protein
MTLPDAVGAVLGFALVVAGVAMLSVPASLVTAGAMLLTAALWPKRHTPHTPKETRP